MAQGKAWDKQKVIEVLKPYFQLGCSIRTACKYAGLADSTFITWVGDDPELRLQIGAWQNEVNAKARKNWRDRIATGEYGPSKEWLAANEKDEWSTKVETETTVKHELTDKTQERIDEWKSALAKRTGGDVPGVAADAGGAAE